MIAKRTMLAFVLALLPVTSANGEVLRCTYSGMDKTLRLYHLGAKLVIELNRDLATARVNDFHLKTGEEWAIARIVRDNKKLLAVQWRQSSKRQPVFGNVKLAFRFSLRKETGDFILSGSDKGTGAAGGSARGTCKAVQQ